MIELLTADTPNGKKISIMLEEIGFEYKVTKIDISRDEQFKPNFKKISPFNKIPVVIDHKNNTSLFQEFIKNASKSPSSKAQQNFLNIITNVADVIKKICVSEKLIFDVNYDGKKYWQSAKKYQACFIDGGVFSSFLSSSAPFAIRAKSYIVKPDEALHKREVFEETVKFVGDLYDADIN